MTINARRFAHLSPDYDAVAEGWAAAFATVTAEANPPEDSIARSWAEAFAKAGVATRKKMGAPASSASPRRLIPTSRRGEPL